ncbi:MAG: transposase [Desulfovibrionaceae bacterium]|jgi:transposase|nr:transposase [Desulfovibrionaceae bacterium]
MPRTAVAPSPGPDAEALFAALCGEDGLPCPRCGSLRRYVLADGRLRCASCAYTYHRYTGRWINQSGLDREDWLDILRLFHKGFTVARMGAALGRSYNAVHKALTTLRLAVLAACPASARLMDASGALASFCPAGKPESDAEHCVECRSPVFSIRTAHGADGPRAEVRPVDGLRAREVMGYPLARNMWQTFIYTDRCRGYDALLFSCCRTVRRVLATGVREGFEPVALDESPFWAFTRPWLGRYRAIAPETYPLYLKEIEFRYNRRRRDERAVVAELARLLCALVPNRED